MKLIVCTMQRYAPNPHSCGNGGGVALADRLGREIAEHGLSIELERKACLGMCLKGPNVQLQPEGRNWHEVRETREIVAYLKHLHSKT